METPPPSARLASPPPEVPRPRVRRVALDESIPSVLPVRSFRFQTAELCGSLAMATMLAAVAGLLWAALGRGNLSTQDLAQQFFLTVGACWLVLVPAKIWCNHKGDSWRRRLIMLFFGLGLGWTTLWLDGWQIHGQLPVSIGDTRVSLWLDGPRAPNQMQRLAGYMSYFALAFFLLRWWKIADRRRPHRFSFAPVIAASFWGLVLLPAWQDTRGPWLGTLVLASSAAIVQLVSPWDQPPPPASRRMKLRYAG